MTGVRVRSVEAIHGWRWITGGMALFRANPLLWMMMVMAIYVGTHLLLLIPFVGMVAVLVVPHLIAGMCHGCQGITQGKPLRLGYLASGFLKSAGPLVTIGGVSLIGQLLTLFVMMAIGGDAINTASKAMAEGAATPSAVEAMRAAAPRVTLALIAGVAISLPLMMAVWFAPLLVFFDDIKPLNALALSLWGCLRNLLAFLVYGMVVIAVLVVLMPLGLAAHQHDLGVWLLAPILIPSLYVSYRDLFAVPRL
jgi:hypothetical protein